MLATIKQFILIVLINMKHTLILILALLFLSYSFAQNVFSVEYVSFPEFQTVQESPNLGLSYEEEQIQSHSDRGHLTGAR